MPKLYEYLGIVVFFYSNELNLSMSTVDTVRMKVKLKSFFEMGLFKVFD